MENDLRIQDRWQQVNSNYGRGVLNTSIFENLELGKTYKAN